MNFKKIEDTKYSISECGTVRNDLNGKILSVCYNTNGYPCVSINGAIKQLHRLVAKTFIPNPDNKPCVNHKDSNRKNPNVTNLEWCTYSENNKHAWDNDRMPKTEKMLNRSRNAIAKATEAQKKMVLCTETGIYYESISDAAATTNIKRTTLANRITGKNKVKSKFVLV